MGVLFLRHARGVYVGIGAAWVGVGVEGFSEAAVLGEVERDGSVSSFWTTGAGKAVRSLGSVLLLAFKIVSSATRLRATQKTYLGIGGWIVCAFFEIQKGLSRSRGFVDLFFV
jgi:hypothetical protein